MKKSPQPPVTRKEAVLTAWSRLKKLSGEEGKTELLSALEPAIRRLNLGLFRLVVMGEIKKGKSSLINALLGEPDTLPIQSDVATSTVFKLLYGPEPKFKVFFQPDLDTGRRQPPRIVVRSDLAAFGTEDGNPHNTKRVDFIGVELPNPLLQQGLVMVDTPGVGGLFKSHREITWRYAPNADVILFVLDSVEAVISRDEIQFLKELTSQVTKRVAFVQTKIDAVDAEQWMAWRDRNRAVLSQELGIPAENIPYFAVSSKLKYAADQEHSLELLRESGFVLLLDFLHSRLMPAKELHLAADAGRQLSLLCVNLRRDMAQQLKIRSQANAAELDKLTRECRRALEELQLWERTTYTDALQRFEEKFTDLKRFAVTRIQNEFDPLGSIPREALDRIRTQPQVDAKTIAGSASAIQQECLARVMPALRAIRADFFDGVNGAIKETAAALNKDLVPAGADRSPGDTSALSVGASGSITQVSSGFDQARNFFYGGTAAYMMTYLGLSLVSMVIPVALPAQIVVSIIAIAALAGGAESVRIAEEKRREDALAKLQSILQSQMVAVQKQAVQTFNEDATQLERDARKVFRDLANAMRENLQRQLQEIESTRSATAAQNAQRLKAVESRLRTLDECRKLLTPRSADHGMTPA